MKKAVTKKPASRMEKQEAAAGLLFILPTYFFYFVFMVIPLIMTVYYSFTEYNMVRPPEWVALANYVKLFGDKVVLTTLKNTAFFTVFCMILKIVFGFLLAVLFSGSAMYRAVRSIGRGVLFFPYVVGLSYMALTFGYLFSTDTGAVNWFLVNVLHLSKIPWFTKSNYAMAMLIAIDVWKHLGFSMLLFLAGMQNISQDYYEAASLDGASAWQKTAYITFPLLMPIVVMNIILFTINGLQMFDLPSILTNGGPGNGTRSLVMYIYARAFTKYEMGYASAISIVFLLIMGVISSIQLKLDQENDQ